MKTKKKKSHKKTLIYAVTIVLSVMYIVLGNRLVTGKTAYSGEGNYGYYLNARVTELLDQTENIDVLGSNDGYDVRFRAIVLTGENKGKTVTAVKNYDSFADTKGENDIAVGDKVILYSDAMTNTQDWIFMAYSRMSVLLIVAVAFLVLLVLFGQRKGLNTIVSLIFTILAIFAVLVPAILSGYNIYFSSIITCIYICVMSLLIINGADEKSMTAIFGCLGGIAFSGLLMLVLDRFLHLTGVTSEESVYLISLNTDNPIDLKAIVFGAILIGAIGAIMDVAMSIASSLYEVASSSRDPGFAALLRSGFEIGKDMMGTMTNTLILAYIGSSLALVLLLVAYNTPLIYLFNREMIVVEILQALIGSLGILFTIPLTSLIGARLYANLHRA